MRILHAIVFLVVLLNAFSCQRNTRGSKTVGKKDVIHDSCNTIRYAQGFCLERYDGYTRVFVFNPWKQDDTLASYLLISNPEKVSQLSIQADYKLLIPIDRVAALSSTFLGMFIVLGRSEKIYACSDASRIYDSVLYNRYLQAKLMNLGESMQPNAEIIIYNEPQLLMKYIYGARDETDRKIAAAGIPIAYNLEFMETHPLGRAEWIKFVAAFLNEDILADSVFDRIESSYCQLANLASQATYRPTVLDGSSYNGIWYAAGGRSFPARLYADAAADYYWKNDGHTGSIPLNFEVIIDKQSNTDFWIGPSTGNLNELLAIDSHYSMLKPFRTGRVYHFSKRVNPNGGLDYYESGVVHPDILLKDLISIFHPGLLDDDYETIYLQKVE